MPGSSKPKASSMRANFKQTFERLSNKFFRRIPYKARKYFIIFFFLAALIVLIIVSVVALVSPRPYYNFIAATSSSFDNVNYVKTNDSNAAVVYGSVVEGLLAPSPIGLNSDKADSISTILNMPKFSTRASVVPADDTFDGWPRLPDSTYSLNDNELLTYGAADDVTFSSSPLSETETSSRLGQQWRFHIRNNMYWANGDRVSAEDFVQTIKYAANLSNGSALIREFRDSIPLSGMRELIKEQQDYYTDHGSYRANFEDYENYSEVFGKNKGVWTDSDPSEKARDANKDFFAYKGASEKSHPFLYYRLEDGAFNPSLWYLLGKQLFLPINKRFVESIGGIDKFGFSKDTILSNGPFNIVSYDPDYAVVFERSETYWDREHTIVPRWSYRVLPEVTTQIELFRQGLLSEIEVAPQYLKVFQESKELKRLLVKAWSGNVSRYLKFNLASDEKTGAKAINPEIVNNVHFRRAVSLALNRKAILNTLSVGQTTPAGDTFGAPIFEFFDENNNNLEKYLWRESYALHGTQLGNMKQFNPDDNDKLSRADYVDSQINKDSYNNLALANQEFELFLKDLPIYREKPATVRLLFSAGGTQRFLVPRIQQQLREAFGDRVVFEERGLPDSIFLAYSQQNRDYDLAYGETYPDYQTDAWTFLRLLAAPVPAGVSSGATINVTGLWTYLDGLNWILENEPERALGELNLATSQAELDELKALLTEMKNSPKASTFYSVLQSEKQMTKSARMKLYVKLEKIIRDQAPVISLYQSPGSYYARRVIGATGLVGFTTQYKYAYNAFDVPKTKWSLPGDEIYG